MPHIRVGELGHHRLFCAKPLLEPMLSYYQLNSWNKFQWNLNWNSTIFIQENSFESVVCQNGGHFVQGEMSQTGFRCGLCFSHNTCHPIITIELHRLMLLRCSTNNGYVLCGSWECIVISASDQNNKKKSMVNGGSRPFLHGHRHNDLSNSFSLGLNKMANILQTTFCRNNFFVWVKIWLKFITKGWVNNQSVLVLLIKCHRTSNEPLP